MKRHLSAKEAAQALEISLPTLYAYVSRGLIRSEEVGSSKRERRYFAEDVEKLKQKKENRRNPDTTAEQSLHFGTPVLESAITLISNNQLFYRGYNVLELARNHTVEEVAALIWLDEMSVQFEIQPAILPDFHLAYLSPFERFQILLPYAAAEDLSGYDLRKSAVAKTGARILQTMVTIATQQTRGTIAERLQKSWLPSKPEAAKALSAALILCADHELNASAFTARCIAAAGSNPYQVVIGGLAALKGVKHGGHTERVEALLQEIKTSQDVQPVLAGRLKRGEMIPGFGHKLYPEGDPRGQMLLQMALAYKPLEAVQLLISEMFNLTGEHPSLDTGLVALTQALDLPAGTALTLFALGRTIGWIGHAIEEYESNRMIRPRARYTGRQP